MNQSQARILIIDDEHTLCETMAEVLSEEGYHTETAYDGEQALQKIKNNSYDVIFCDLRMPKIDGLQVLKETVQQQPQSFFIVMTAYGSMDTTIEALKQGAHDYVVKPLIFEDVILKVKNLIAYKKLSIENRILKDSVTEQFALDNILGQGTEMRSVYSLVQKVAPTANIILLTGELGVGKEKLAKAIHYQSKERERRFMAIRCNSYSEEQLERALFDEKGIFNQTKGGTLYLNEISSLSKKLQAKLMDYLSAQPSQPLRLIMASTRDLSKAVVQGEFREDLLYRINVIEIKVPPLRARKKDIPFLVKYYTQKYAEAFGKHVRYVTDRAREVLMNYSWDGNICELQNVLERAVLLCDVDTQYLDVRDLPADLMAMSAESTQFNFREAMRQYEYRHIHRILEKNHFDKKKAATELGLSLSSLYRKIEELTLPMQ